MLSKEEFKELNITFWKEFQSYMSKTRSSSGRRINWLNYPSDVKTIFIRLEVDGKGARLCFDIQAKDLEIRNLIYEQMTELKMVLENTTIIPPIWNDNYFLKTSQMYVARIYWEDNTLNLYKKEDHLKIFEYLKERLVKFDEFYQEYKEILISMVN